MNSSGLLWAIVLVVGAHIFTPTSAIDNLHEHIQVATAGHINHRNDQRQSELKTRSVLLSANELDTTTNAEPIQMESLIDEQILERIATAMLQGEKRMISEACTLALNRTILGIRMRQSWAIASMMRFFFILSRFDGIIELAYV